MASTAIGNVEAPLYAFKSNGAVRLIEGALKAKVGLPATAISSSSPAFPVNCVTQSGFVVGSIPEANALSNQVFP